MNTRDRLDSLISLFRVQADNPTIRRPLLLQGVDPLRDVGSHLAGVRVPVVENESVRREAEITGLMLNLLAEGAKVAHATTDLTHVRTQSVGLTNLLQEGISARMLTNQTKCAISSKVQEVAPMAMHARFNVREPKEAAASAKASASPVVGLQPANPTPEQWEILNTADGGYDERDWEAFTFQRTGKHFAKKAPCKFFPLGTCTQGKSCKFNHTHYKDPKHHRAAVAQESGEPEAHYEEEESAVALE